jgi:Protein of unknown function (DUF3307).
MSGVNKMIWEMFKFYFAILLLCHFLGDYYFQTKKMAQSKESDYKKTIVHGIYYTIPFFAAFIIGAVYLRDLESFAYLFVILAAASVSHLMIDLIKCRKIKADLSKKSGDSANFVHENEKDNKSVLFIADQAAHILILAALAFAINGSKIYASIWASFSECSEILYLALLIVFITVPASVIFKNVFKKYQPTTSSSESIQGAGEIIGFLERILTAVFFMMGEFTAVGFIIAAKSIARYDKISKDVAFAEYYLIGTLYSILVTVAAYLLLCFL